MVYPSRTVVLRAPGVAIVVRCTEMLGMPDCVLCLKFHHRMTPADEAAVICGTLVGDMAVVSAVETPAMALEGAKPDTCLIVSK
jgi:hypothetical protein